MNNYLKTIAAIILLSIANFASAESKLITLNIHTSRNECELFESGSAFKKNPFYLKGKIFESKTGCSVSLPMSEFNEKFEICALSKIEIMNINDSCSFNVNNINDEAEFTSQTHSGANATKPLCSFICKTK
ncbi:MAG: hypothetical protein WAX04_00270 [Oscillospiraceae bacterium]